MEFRWNDWNTEHVTEHGVALSEAESVVRAAQPPHPRYLGDGKWLVWGRGQGGRFVQAVYVVDPDDTFYIIHARLLTRREKSLFRRMQGS
jgi:uncharacterized DUF497 family protein